MYKLTLKCRVITPMFMTGADGRTPELRPSEFKGMMRWWWRAIRAENDIKKLKEDEAKIFGGTGEGEEKSKVQLRIRGVSSLQAGNNLRNDYHLKWHYDRNTNSLDGENAGIGYLLYSTVLPNRERDYIKDGYEFELTLISVDEEAFKKACASLWLAMYLGGFGTRARRGGGNIEVTEVKDNKTFELEFQCNDSKNLPNWLRENVKKVSEIINGTTQAKSFCFNYTNLSFSRFILAKQDKKNWIEALSEVGKIYMDFRNKHRKDIFDVGVFGLPVVYGKNQLVSKGHQRRASPLIIKVLHCKSNYYWMVLRMAGEFLPESDVLKFNNKSQKPAYRLIEEFWQELKESGTEYILTKPEILDKIVNQIKAQLKPRKVIFFGSRARGDAHKKSDIDIAVETDIPLERGNLQFPVDIVNLKKASESLRKKIELEGIYL